MDYAARLARLRERMEAADVDLVYLTRGANLFYLTGIRRQLVHGTDHNAYGDWATGAYFGRDGGLIVVAPRMGGAFFAAEGAGKPWVDRVRLILETEAPLDVMRDAIASVCPRGMRHLAVDDHAWAETSLALRSLMPSATVSLASALVMPLRMIKDADEVEAMRRASAVADLVWERTVPFLRVGVTEYEVAREVDYQFQIAGAEYTSFETGISFWGAAETGGDVLRSGHARRLQPGDSVTFDFGCVLDGYCSDFGRCAFVGEPPAEYRRVHELVLAAQAAGMAAMRAGQVTAAEVNAAARRVIAEAGYDAAFTHRLGHATGVTVHEPPFLDVMDHTVLQENMLFTVEPSVFIPGRLGNRVEDVVRVAAGGGVALNRAPHDLALVG